MLSGRTTNAVGRHLACGAGHAFAEGIWHGANCTALMHGPCPIQQPRTKVVVTLAVEADLAAA
jgi:hypothetical protein